MTPTTFAVNQRVELAAGARGDIIIMRAWCDTCGVSVIPRADGECSACGSPIVDEDRLPVKEILAGLEHAMTMTYNAPLDELEKAPAAEDAGTGDNGSPPTPPSAMPAPSRARPAAQIPPESRPKRGRPPMTDDSEVRATIIATIQDIERTTGQVPPGAAFVGSSRGDRPSLSTISRIFGNYGNAVEAAGFARPKRGGDPTRRRARTTAAAPTADELERVAQRDLERFARTQPQPADDDDPPELGELLDRETRTQEILELIDALDDIATGTIEILSGDTGRDETLTVMLVSFIHKELTSYPLEDVGSVTLYRLARRT